MKKKILSGLILISVIILGINVAAGIIRANRFSNAFSVLVDNQTGEDISAIRLSIRAYDNNNSDSFEKVVIRTFSKMSPGNREEFTFNMSTASEASAGKADLTGTVHLNGESSEAGYTIESAAGIPIKEGKRTLIKLVGNRTSGFKAEFVDLI